MSNEAVLEALRSMATQSLKRAAEKSAQDELLAGMIKEQKEEALAGEQSDTPNLPNIEIVKPTLTLERQIQVHDETIIETEKLPEEQKVVDIKVANINFEVEELGTVYDLSKNCDFQK